MNELTEGQIRAKINDNLSQAMQLLMEKAATANCQELMEIIQTLQRLKSLNLNYLPICGSKDR